MHKVIIKYIEEELAAEVFEDELTEEDDLLGSGILDSMGMMKLIAFLEEEFKVTIGPEDMVIENFMTVGHISEYLSSK